MEDALPFLRSYCQKQGLDFQIADMRWGIRDDAQDDHQTTNLCLTELVHCQQTSNGPYFVAFLGDRYGYRPYPSEIEQSEFEILKRSLKKRGKPVDVMNDWFVQDTNAVPAVYVLQPITSKLPYYNDMSEQNSQLPSKDKEQWISVNKLLANSFRTAAEIAYEEGKISEERKHVYFRSVTECEVFHGILQHSLANDRTLCFQRTINNINGRDKLAGRFTDLDGNGADVEANNFMENLKLRSVPNVLKHENLYKSVIHWDVGGVNENNPEHADYLKSTVEMFKAQLMRLIEANASKQMHLNSDPNYSEVLLHLHFCKKKVEHFKGRTGILSKIKEKLSSSFKNEVKKLQEEKGEKEEGVEKQPHHEDVELLRAMESMGVTFSEVDGTPNEAETEDMVLTPLINYKKPLIVSGESGSGKTALMARIAEESINWFGRNTIRLIRFLGTSPKSSSIRETIVSLCQQIWKNYNMKSRSDIDEGKDFSYLFLYFNSLLRSLNTSKAPLVIILDSVDQLTSKDSSQSMKWLPTQLPPNVYIVVSMISEKFLCHQNILRILNDDTRQLVLDPLPKETAVEILDSWLDMSSRTLTNQQKENVMNAFQKCPQPLFLKLMFEQAKAWKSYTPLDECQVGISVRSAIDGLFDDLEKLHGQTLISRSLGYLTASKYGLEDGEIEDLLSMDDEVLQDTYLYHLPPSETVIRLPPLLWRRVQNQLKEYLTSRQADGKNVTTWYHRQFLEAAQERYVHNGVKKDLHHMLADYFTGKWHNKVKPLELFKKKKGSYPKAYRNVPEQPICFKDSGIINERKLSELPVHLIESGRFEDFLSYTCRDFEWLYNKCRAKTLTEVLSDLDHVIIALKYEVSSEQEDTYDNDNNLSIDTDPAINEDQLQDIPRLNAYVEEVEFLRDLLVLGSDSIRKDPANLALQILGQLGTKTDILAGLSSLRDSTMSWCNNTYLPLLTPQTHCLPTIGRELKTSVDVAISYAGDEFEDETKLTVSEDGKTLWVVDRQKKGDHIKKLDLENQGVVSELLTNWIPSIDTKSIKLTGSDRYLMVEAYIQRESYNAKFYTTILNSDLTEVSALPSVEHEVLGVSDSGIYCVIFLEQGTVTDLIKERTGKKVNQSDPKRIMCENRCLVNLETGEVTPLLLPALDPNDENSFVTRSKDDRSKGLPGTQWATFSPDDEHFVLCNLSKGYFLFQRKTGRKLYTWPEEENKLPRFSSGKKEKDQVAAFVNNEIFVGRGTLYSSHSKLLVMDVQTGKQLHEFEMIPEDKGGYSIDLLEFNRDKSLVAVATKSNVISNGNRYMPCVVWDIQTRREISRCDRNSRWSKIKFHGTSSEFLLTAAWRENIIYIYYIGTAAQPVEKAIAVHKIIGHSGDIVFLQVTSDDQTLVTASADNSVKLWDAEKLLKTCKDTINSFISIEALRAEVNKDLKRPFEPGEGPVQTTCTAVSKDGATALLGTKDGWVIYYDLKTNRSTEYEKVGESVKNALCTTDGEYFVSCSDTIKVWDAKTGTCVRTIDEKVRGENMSGLACITERNNVLAAGYAGMECFGYLWDLKTGERLQILKGLYGFSHIALSSDARFAVSTFFDFPMLYDVKTAELKTNMSQPDTMMAGCTALAVSPNDLFVVSCSSDGSIRVSNAETGKFTYRMQAKSSVVSTVFAPDSTVLVTACFKDMTLWSMTTGQLLHTLQRHTDFVCQLKFALDGRYLVSCGKDKHIIVWDYQEKRSVAAFQAHCPVDEVSVADNLSSILFSPHNVAYLGLLQPNCAMQDIIDGKAEHQVPDAVLQAQGLALTFSGSSIQRKTSQSCNIL